MTEIRLPGKEDLFLLRNDALTFPQVVGAAHSLLLIGYQLPFHPGGLHSVHSGIGRRILGRGYNPLVPQVGGGFRFRVHDAEEAFQGENSKSQFDQSSWTSHHIHALLDQSKLSE